MPTKTKGKSPIREDEKTGTGSNKNNTGGSLGGGLSTLEGITKGLGVAGAVSGMGLGAFNAGKAVADEGAGAGEVLLEGALGAFGLDKLYTSKRAKRAQAEKIAKAKAAAELASKQSAENAKLAQNAAGSNVNLYDQNAEELSSSPFRALTKKLKGIKGLVPANMSAAQYKSSLKMQEISGVNTLSNY